MRTVLAHGVFDLLHVGHLEHLRRARMLGDKLCVSVVPDKFIEKHIGRPIYNEVERLTLVDALKCVDGVFLCDGPGPENVIRLVKPDLYVRGEDYAGKEMPESALLREMGIPVVYTQSVPPRTGEIIERILARAR